MERKVEKTEKTDEVDIKESEAICAVTQNDDIKIDNIVDTKYNDDNNNETSEAGDSQEISFANRTQDKEYDTVLANSIHKEWSNIKDEYSSLSQNKMEYKTFDNEGGRKKKYDHYDDDTMSVTSRTSVISNTTDISQIKQIHIQDTAKSKKPSFF